MFSETTEVIITKLCIKTIAKMRRKVVPLTNDFITPT